MSQKLPKVLIIDDEEDFYLTLYYSNPGCKTLKTEKKEALEYIKNDKDKIDIILLDLSLKGTIDFQQGLIFLKELQEEYIRHMIPIIVVTKDPNIRTYQDALNLGASGFMYKGQYDPQKLETAITTVLENFQPGDFSSYNTLQSQRFIEFAESINTVDIAHSNEDTLKKIINHIFTYPSVCPLDSPFYGQPGISVMTQTVIDIFKSPNQPVNLWELRKILQFAIGQAGRNAANQIRNEHLPEGLTLQASKLLATPQYSAEEKIALDYILQIENQLQSNGHSSPIFQNHIEIEKKLKEYHLKYPRLFNTTESQRVCEEFKLKHGFNNTVKLLIISHEKSKIYSDQLTKQLSNTIRQYPLEVNTNHLSPGDKVEETMTQLIKNADIIVIKFCPDLLNWDFWHSIISSLIITHPNEVLTVMPVKARPCNLEDTSYQGLTPLIGTNTTPIILSGLTEHELDHALANASLTLKTKIETFKSH